MCKKTIKLFPLFFLLFFLGCGGNDSEIPEGVWVDESTGLMWQNEGVSLYGDEKRSVLMDDYCGKFTLAGYEDWRMPDIGELRSIIDHCEAMETGGSCGVSATCTDFYDCWSEESCQACERNNSGYLKEGLQGGLGWYWSSSKYLWTDEDGHEYSSVWYVDGLDGQVSLLPRPDIDIESQDQQMAPQIRCVRNR